MPRGDKDKYTEKQKRKAEHIEESYEAKGVSKDEAEGRAWATVNKQSGGGERKGGSGQKTGDVAKTKARKSSARRAVATRQGVPRSGQQLEDMSKTELMSRARKQQIAGRSTMRKAELIEALRRSS
jgi:plasmid stabilization system protein ParE